VTPALLSVARYVADCRSGAPSEAHTSRSYHCYCLKHVLCCCIIPALKAVVIAATAAAAARVPSLNMASQLPCAVTRKLTRRAGVHVVPRYAALVIVPLHLQTTTHNPSAEGQQ
jgi:hypothetical protein